MWGMAEGASINRRRNRAAKLTRRTRARLLWAGERFVTEPRVRSQRMQGKVFQALFDFNFVRPNRLRPMAKEDLLRFLFVLGRSDARAQDEIADGDLSFELTGMPAGERYPRMSRSVSGRLRAARNQHADAAGGRSADDGGSGGPQRTSSRRDDHRCCCRRTDKD